MHSIETWRLRGHQVKCTVTVIWHAPDDPSASIFGEELALSIVIINLARSRKVEYGSVLFCSFQMERVMTEKITPPKRPHLTENFRPVVPTEKPVPGPATGHGVEGNYVPPTSEKPSSPPPMPKK